MADDASAIAAIPAPKRRWWLALIGLVLIISGSLLAHNIRSSDGIRVTDVRFTGTNGTAMSALLYVPATATAATPAPGILAVHGYINSRETQDGFALEFARRGYVVVAMDQTGHGYSDGPAFANGFGGPDGLRFLRSLPMVDRAQIGLEGHSMGGWTVLAAAAAMPDAYQSIVLEGSSTGAPFAAEGTPDWPRNLSLVFSQYDEFSEFMWDSPVAADVERAPKLMRLFGADAPVAEGRIYGSVAAGTARVLHQPATTHPGDHFSHDAIGHATDWFAATLRGGTPRPATDQIWLWQEIGTGIALVGFVLLMLGAFDVLIGLPFFERLRGAAVPASAARDRTWWRAFALNTSITALLFFPAFIAVYLLMVITPTLPPSASLPQVVTTQVTFWALVCAGIGWLLSRRRAHSISLSPWFPALLIALCTVATGYAALAAVDALFTLDFRLWIVAVKLPSLAQLAIVPIYVVPLALTYLVTMRTLCGELTVAGDGPVRRMIWAVLALTGGFITLLGIDYALLFTTGTLPTAFDALSTIIALQFVPLLAIVAVIGIFTWTRTGSHRVGALICGLFITLYVVAGTATQI